jgi:hypothetical protein
MAMHETHQRLHGLPGVGDADGGIESQTPGLRFDIDENGWGRGNRRNRWTWRNRAARPAGPDGGGGKRRRRMRQHHRPAFNHQAGMRVGNLKVVDAIGIKIAVLPERRGRGCCQDE